MGYVQRVASTFLLIGLSGGGQSIPKPLDRLEGKDLSSGISYLRLFLPGTQTSSNLPLLIAQCTLLPGGQYRFELFTSFDPDTDRSFHPPWKKVTEDDLFAPRTLKVKMTMEFLGYTHVKPVKREWEIPDGVPGQYRYNEPSIGSANMEPIAYYFQYLRALPTLHLTLGGSSATFQTASLLEQLRREPLCRAAGL